MHTIHYDLGHLRVAVTSSVPETQPALDFLYPLAGVRPKDPDSAYHCTADETGLTFALTGEGEDYRTTDPRTLVPALETSIRERFIAQAGQSWALHSSGFLTEEGQAVLILGQAGAGKTTLALQAIAAGACGLSDELHVWQPSRGKVSGYPRAYAIKEGTFRRFPEFGSLMTGLAPSQWNERPLWYVPPARLGRHLAAQPVTLRALVLLSREGYRGPLRLVPHWKRLSAILPHAWIPQGLAFEDHMEEAMTALASVEVWEGGPEAILENFAGLRAVAASQ